MLQYRTPNGERRKPSLGVFGQLTVDQARKLAQEHLAAVRAGENPSQERQEARGAPTVKELSERFMTEYSEARNKPSSVRTNRLNLGVHVLPAFGRMKVAELERPDVAALIGRMRDTPAAANHTLSLLRKMFIWRNSGACDRTARTRAVTCKSTPARSAPGSSSTKS